MVRAVGTMVNSGSSVDYPGTTTAVRLKYRGEEVTYTISSAEIELFLEDYASSNNGVKKRSTGTVKEVERFVWQFFEFVRTGRLIKCTNRGRSRTAIKAPEEDVEYHITRRELERYVTVILSEYSSASAAKRLKIVKRFLREMGIPVQYLRILDNGIRLTERAKKKEQEFKTPILTVEDGREVFKRLERLYDLGAINYCQYIKAISFVLVEFATGLRVSEIARLKAEHVDFENHRIVLSTRLTKEGKLLNLKEGNKVVFLTREAETALKFYINECRDKITGQDGYLFVTNAPTVLEGRQRLPCLSTRLSKKQEV